MGKLTNLKSSLKTLGPVLGYSDPVERRLAPRPVHHDWYNTRQWKDLRDACLIRDLYTCQNPTCGKMYGTQPGMLHVDHKIPHRGRRDLFFCGLDGLQTLCVHCHVAFKQKQEQSIPPGVWY